MPLGFLRRQPEGGGIEERAGKRVCNFSKEREEGRGKENPF